MFLEVTLKLREQNSWEETILVPSLRLANFSFSSWFSFGPKAKLFVNMILEGGERDGEIERDREFLVKVCVVTHVADWKISSNAGSRKSPFTSSNSP